MNKKRQGDFTLIELLIVVAILGILAAVIVPNLGRLLGGGEATAQNSEFESVKTGVISMMVDAGLSTLPNPRATTGVSPCTTGTQDMATYPDDSTLAQKQTAVGGTWSGSDVVGFILFGHDTVGNAAATPLTNYVETTTASSCYTVDAEGTVTQYDTAGVLTNP